MDQVACGWLIYELTDSAFQLGLVRGIQAIPILLLSPLAGSTADRYSRKMQVMVAQVVEGLLYAVIESRRHGSRAATQRDGSRRAGRDWLYLAMPRARLIR